MREEEEIVTGLGRVWDARIGGNAMKAGEGVGSSSGRGDREDAFFGHARLRRGGEGDLVRDTSWVERRLEWCDGRGSDGTRRLREELIWLERGKRRWERVGRCC